MKLIHTLALGLAGLGFSAAALAEDIKINVPGTPAPAPAVAGAPTPATFSEAQVLEMLGWMAGKSTQIEIFKLNATQIGSVMKGMSQALAGKDAPYDVEKIGPLVQAFGEGKQKEFMRALAADNEKQSVAYFAKLKENKSIVELPSGLCYEIVQPGSGDYPKASDMVKVHYTGKLLDGSVFDSSVERKQPVEFPLSNVIAGWTEGIQKINKGGKIRLHIPAKLAYGEAGREVIPPNASLVFDVELLDFKPTPGPASLAPAK